MGWRLGALSRLGASAGTEIPAAAGQTGKRCLSRSPLPCLRAPLAALLLGVPAATCASQSPAATDLLILQSSPDALALSRSTLRTAWKDATILASSDCAELRPDLFVLASRAGGPKGARPPGGSHVRKCTIKRGSLTMRGIPAVDPSFARLREAPITFSSNDVLTSQRAGLLLRPWYSPDPEDPREGLRVAVEDLSRGRRVIEQDCARPEVARSATDIAIACAVEQIGEQPLFRTIVYRAGDLAKVRTVPKCRRPRLDPGTVLCSGQSIGSNGQITEETRSFPL